MDNSKTPDNTGEDEEQIGILLRAAGTRKPLPQHMQVAWEAGFRKELEKNRVGRRNKFYKLATLCATVVVSLALIIDFVRTPAFPASTLVLRSSGENSISSEEGVVETAYVGQRVEERSLLATGKASFLSFQYRNYAIRLNSDTRLQVLENHLRLRSGQIYVSSLPAGQFTNSAELSGLSIHTPLATITDIGTQFTVDVSENTVTSIVREGVIEVSTAKTHTSAKATPDNARRIKIDENQRIVSSMVVAHGEAWDWIYAVSEPFQTTGRTYYDYFVWCAQEAGLKLEFESEAAERMAKLDRPNDGLIFTHPLKSLKSITASTPELSAQVLGNTLVVKRYSRK